jgi:PAS domain S-box-containing protein
MSNRAALTWQRSVRDGAFFTTAAALVLELAALAFGRVPDPSGVLALLVVVCAFIRGPAGGLASAAAAVLFMLLDGMLGGRVMPEDGRWLLRVITAAFTLPLLAVLVGFLHKQTQHRLERERRARAEAEAAERRYRDLVEGLGAVVWQVDAEDFRVQFVSRRAVDLFAYPVTEWLDSHRIWQKLIHPDDFDRVMAQREDAVGSAQPYEIEYRVITRTGNVLWVRTLVHIERDDGGKTRSLRGVMFDITERRRANEILRGDQERYRTLLDHAADALLVHDATGRFVDVNQSACQALGYGRDELLSMNAADVELGFDPVVSAESWKSLSPGRAHTYSASYRRKDGSTYQAEVRVARLLWDGRHLMVALARDVTERLLPENRPRQVPNAPPA